MKKWFILSTIISFSIVAFSGKTYGEKAPHPLQTEVTKNELLSTVMSPEVERTRMGKIFPKPKSFSMAERLGTLENKTVYLIENGFGGSHRFMAQLEQWFDEHMPAVNTVLKRKPGQVFMDDPADTVLWEEVKEKGGSKRNALKHLE